MIYTFIQMSVTEDTCISMYIGQHDMPLGYSTSIVSSLTTCGLYAR